VKVKLVGSTRADDIVRDADILHLYKKVGVERWLIGMESYDEAILKKIRKGGTPLKDRQAIQLLRQTGILSMATWVVGFVEETDRDYRHGLQQLLAYDPDQVQLLYATPHRWTPFYRLETGRRVIQTDTRRWDYKHQVLATRHMPPWRELVWVKFIEAVMQLRPRTFFRLLFMRDPRSEAPTSGPTAWVAAFGRKRSSAFTSGRNGPPTAPPSPTLGGNRKMRKRKRFKHVHLPGANW
jgi:anaerobic magnesium-protoporphyrin IX monomethyl ester cyclase